MKIPKKEHQIGNTKVIIHSALVTMSSGERTNWFISEMEKGNKVLKDIAIAVEACYQE